MSPHQAYHSPVVLFYAVLVYGILAVAGLLLAVLRWGFRANVDHAWQSYCGWLVMVPLTTAAILLGREATIFYFTVVVLFGFREFARATGLDGDWFITGGVYLGILAVGVVTLVPAPRASVPGGRDWFMALPVFVMAGLLAVPILRDRVRGQLQAVATASVGFLYFGWMGGHLAFLANAEQAYAYLLYLLFAVEVSDVAGFLSGKLFGRHPLRGTISPKKTWEGAAGALAVSLALPWLLWFTFPHFQVPDLLATGLIVGIGGQVGDMTVSVFKRDLGIKDMGAAIPGHGGILDRIDSLLYVAPLFFHYIGYRHGLAPAM